MERGDVELAMPPLAVLGMIREVFVHLRPPRPGDPEVCHKPPDCGKERVPATPGHPGPLCDGREENAAFLCRCNDLSEDRLVVLAGDPQCTVKEQECSFRQRP